jgi:hypothetical protein
LQLAAQLSLLEELHKLFADAPGDLSKLQALLRAEPPYAGLVLNGATGLSAAQRAGLVALGAVAE